MTRVVLKIDCQSFVSWIARHLNLVGKVLFGHRSNSELNALVFKLSHKLAQLLVNFLCYSFFFRHGFDHESLVAKRSLLLL